MATTTTSSLGKMTTLVQTIVRAVPQKALTTMVIGGQTTTQANPGPLSLSLPSIQPWGPSLAAMSSTTTLLTVTTATLVSPNQSSRASSSSVSSSNTGPSSQTASEASTANGTNALMPIAAPDGLSTGAKAGLGVGLALGLISLAVLALFLYRKWQARKARSSMQITINYDASPRGTLGGAYSQLEQAERWER